MSFSTLPAVLIQLIMQASSYEDIIALAQTSRHSLHSADSPVAFRFCAPLQWKLRHQTIVAPAFVIRPLPAVYPAAHRLVAHCPFAIHWMADLLVRTAHVQELLAVAAAARIVELRILCETIADSHSMRILASPHLHALRLLHLIRPSPDAIRLVAAIPLLHSLQCDEAHIDPNCFVALPSSTSLTSIHLNDAGYSKSNVLPFVSAMPTLRCLSLVNPGFYGAAFLEFCTAPAMSSLEELRLERWNPHNDYFRPPVISGHLKLGFKALKSLRVLRLAEVDDGGQVLQVLRHAPALTQLFLRSDSQNGNIDQPSLEFALRSARKLRVQFVCHHPIAPSALARLRSLVRRLQGDFGVERVAFSDRWRLPLDA